MMAPLRTQPASSLPTKTKRSSFGAGRVPEQPDARRSEPAGAVAGKSELPRIKRPVTVKEQVYRTLREQLANGRMAPKERIVETELTKQLGVSRTPVREALTRLASEGFLAATHYGYRVPDFSAEDILNLSEIRLLLEPAAARQAAESATKADRDRMRQIIAEERAAHAAGDVSAFLSAHHRFRAAWLGCARNNLLVEALARTLHSISLIRWRTMVDVELRSFIIASHDRFLVTLGARNPDQAARVQAEIIDKFTSLMLAKLFGAGGNGDGKARSMRATSLHDGESIT
jgi:DNA-binding GntR family transcriptional regulator